MEHIKKYLWWYVGALSLLLIGIVLYFNSKKESKQQFLGGALSLDSNSNDSFLDSFPLKKGSRGSNVEKLQTYLRQKQVKRDESVRYIVPPTYLEIDGIFGDKTEAALLEFTNRKSVSEEYFKKLNL